MVLQPLVRHGVGLESHPQNVLVRVNTSSKKITGFAVRDFGGIRIHLATFIRSGNDPGVIPRGALNLTDDMHIVQDKVHHALFQVHVGHLLYMLGLESHGGWAIVREEMERALNPRGDPDGRVLHDAFLKKTMSFKCFMEMRLRGVYRGVSPFRPFMSYTRLIMNSITTESCRMFCSGICSYRRVSLITAIVTQWRFTIKPSKDAWALSSIFLLGEVRWGLIYLLPYYLAFIIHGYNFAHLCRY